MSNSLPVESVAKLDTSDTSVLIQHLEQAEDLLQILVTTANWVNQPDIYAWLMLPIVASDSDVYVVSRHQLPRENVRGLIEEFLWSIGSTATAYGAAVPAPDVIEIKQASLSSEGTWEPMNEPLFVDVGVATRGKLHAVLRACTVQHAGEDVSTAAQRVARVIGPYVDACLLVARGGGQRVSADGMEGFLEYTAFRHRLQLEVSGLRRNPREMGLLRVKLVPRQEVTAVEQVERAYRMVNALVQSAVRDSDTVGELDEGDIGVLMPNTGPRRALVAAMRLSDALSENPSVSEVLRHFVGVSGWAITGSDVEGLLLETELAAAQAQCASTGAVQLFT